MTDPLLETWQINARVVLYVFDALEDAVFVLAAPGKGRSAPQMFAHLHDVRVMWLESGVALREAGFPLDRKTAFGVWEWGVR